mmetsp:Transcript_67425/g.213422  ORF Transcript_67425/g.213422 Transcript_67425/m.213422 type:complete len:237 (-) Transcript_67425:107-817(-)
MTCKPLHDAENASCGHRKPAGPSRPHNLMCPVPRNSPWVSAGRTPERWGRKIWTPVRAFLSPSRAEWIASWPNDAWEQWRGAVPPMERDHTRGEPGTAEVLVPPQPRLPRVPDVILQRTRDLPAHALIGWVQIPLLLHRPASKLNEQVSEFFLRRTHAWCLWRHLPLPYSCACLWHSGRGPPPPFHKSFGCRDTRAGSPDCSCWPLRHLDWGSRVGLSPLSRLLSKSLLLVLRGCF